MSAPTIAPAAPTPAMPSAYHTRLLVLGLGNDLLSDDAVGLRVARRIGQECQGDPAIVARESMEMGLALLDETVGCETLILVDAIVTGTAPPGHIFEFDSVPSAGRHAGAPHFLGVGDTLALGRSLGMAMPQTVRIFAIEVLDPYTLGTELSPAVAGAVETAAKRIIACAVQRQPTATLS